MIVHQRQPSKNSCGQTCVAMLVGSPAQSVIDLMHDRTGTTWERLRSNLALRGYDVPQRLTPYRGSVVDFPTYHEADVALCRVRWGSDPKDRRAHWVLWAEGRFWDPLSEQKALFLRSPFGRILSYAIVKRRTWNGGHCHQAAE